MKRSRKALSLFLTLALALTPALGGTARADGAGKAIRLGADVLAKLEQLRRGK